MKTNIIRLTLFLVFCFPLSIYSADNEVYIQQSGATANVDVEQLGSGNIIGGSDAVAGTMTPLDLDGGTLTLDINLLGDSNKFLGDIWADNYTGFFEFTGDSNTFNIQTDPSNTFGADNTDANVQVTGSNNTFTLNQAVTGLASGLDLDWTIQGSDNAITANIDYDSAINYISLDGSDNTVTFDGDGYANGYFKLEQTGGNRTFNIEQQSTLENDWLHIISNGSNGTMCVIQNDGGTTTGC